ncbi:uncharacterized protein LOC110452580 isoform X4 [Mizuhopecten yessoensis]|uniref:uncharacterized protein LOC110452580 isoform X4 n=1 Tax=Mizuhopecten yessoensis TaxID=6573 RepID=UPI000B4583DC|nr:uncharacterized protein LOC110452580 isoform X4 [Mizuhopecten yessoensis]
MEVLRPSPIESGVEMTYDKKDIRAALAAHNAQKQKLSYGQPAPLKDSPRLMSFRRRAVKGLSPMSMNSDCPSFTTGSSRTMYGASITPLKSITTDSPYTSMSQQLLPSKDLPVLSKSAPPIPDVPPSWKGSSTNPKLRHMSFNTGSRLKLPDDGDFSVNPEPVPFQPQNFMNMAPQAKGYGGGGGAAESSTSMKKIPIPKRHLDSFGGYEYNMGAKRGIILHTDRYQWDSPKVFEGLSQRERLRAELEYMERLRYVKRRREVLPHRAQIDLLMGGKKVDFVERFDIQKEIQKLKSLIMPQNARDLFHGRGIPLPTEHSSVKPRRPPLIDYDSDEDITSSARSTFQRSKYSHDPDMGGSKSKSRRNYDGHLPRINTRTSMLDDTPRGKKALSVRVHEMLGESDRFSEDGPWTPLLRQESTFFGTQPAYLRRSRTNVSKFENAMPRSYTSVHGRPDRDLKVTPKAENVRRVDIPSAGAVPRIPQSRGRSGTNPDPGTIEIPETTENIEHDDPASMEAYEDLTDRQKMMASRTSKTASPVKPPATPNPLRGSELPQMIPETERSELHATFKKLDTDSDGHLKFDQLQTQLPKQMSQQQARFLKEVYDITSSNTFFGVDEFLLMSSLTKLVTNMSTSLQATFQMLNFNSLKVDIIAFVEIFQSVDRGQKGKISLDSLREVLNGILGRDLESDTALWNKIVETVNPSEAIQITKIEFLAYIPYFMSLKES